MAQLLVTGTDSKGNASSVVITVEKSGSGETILTGDIGGVVAAGTVARLRGNCRLIADLHVRGTLLCDPSGVDLDGQNLFDIHTHDGTLNLVGTEKTAWVHWGDVVAGWQIGDRLAVAPTAVGVFVPTEITWQGSWAATPRPANSPDVTLVDGSIARPEVANLSQTNTFRNLKRTMIHEASAPNPQTLKWIRFLDCGVTGELTMYPIHFHLIGDHARGSLLEGVVVEGGRNHAFVPHAAHGVTLKGCVAYNTTGEAYWWDAPVGNDIANNSNDSDWIGNLALWVKGTRATGFSLGEGVGNKLVDSVASCVQGAKRDSGIKWPEPLDGVWVSERLVAHNNKNLGVFVWQNGATPKHHVLDLITYNNGGRGVLHGAYRNIYHYQNLILHEPVNALSSHALPTPNPTDRLLFEDVLTNSTLEIAKHNNPSPNPVVYRRCVFTQVVVRETMDGGTNPGFHQFEDCGLVPGDFDLAGIVPGSVIEILEGGVLEHRWASGVWS